MAQVYVWGKYNLNVKYEEDHSAHAPKQGDINNFWVGKSYSFSAVSGKYTLNNALEMSRENDAAQYPYAIDGAMAGDGVYYAEEAYGINKTAGWISSSGKLAYRIPDTLSGKIFYPVYYGAKTIKEKGVYIEDVTSESENTYPKDGISGSYYYVFKYAVPGVPSITVPGAAMIGHAVDISWEAADSAESYKLERRVDSGGWTQVYEGAGLTYADTVQVEWSNVQYRVSASISGVYHAGDGANGPGNAKSIGIEICVNEDGDFEKAKDNAASLVRLLMAEHGIPSLNIKQHNNWSGKDCPHTIRHTSGAWAAFLDLCNGYPVDAQLSAAVDKLAAKGLINSPDYWKDGVYSAANVQALLKKWAASL